MKKVAVGFILLVILGIVGLALGWINIPDQTYAVVRTAFSGFDKKVLEPGASIWRWEKIIPTGLTLYMFPFNTYTIDTESPVKGGMFPSGNDYAKALGENIDFQFDLKFSLECRFMPENLVALAENGLRPETLNQWYAEKTGVLAEKVSQLVLKDPQLFFKEGYLESIRSICKDDAALETLEISAIDPISVNVPDYELYLHIKKRYLDLERLKLEAETAKINAEKERDLLAIKKEIDIIQNLERYSDVFRNSPILMEFLYMRNLTPEDFLKLMETNTNNNR